MDRLSSLYGAGYQPPSQHTNPVVGSSTGFQTHPGYSQYQYGGFDQPPPSLDADSSLGLMSMQNASNFNESGKRPPSSPLARTDSKRARFNESTDAIDLYEDETQGSAFADAEGKAKSSRGAR